MNFDTAFYNNKTVLITGHTGFKGTWLTKILVNLGANVIGYSLEAPTNPNLYDLSRVSSKIVSIIGDIRDIDYLLNTIQKYKPEIIFHLAAQPIVRESYINPRYTYETNVMGTVNILECVRKCTFVKSVLNVTTDKVYLNNDDLNHPFKEDEPLDGFDPYSNSKSCSELVTHCYKKSFFDNGQVRISTARAGNVIGGGDFAKDRIIPDCVRAVEKNKEIVVRNPYSTRPYQHVLEPLFLYLLIAEKQYFDVELSGYYNVGPDKEDFVTTGDLVNIFCKYWGNGCKWVNISDNGPHEASFLSLDNTLIKKVFGWKPTWHINRAIQETVNFTKIYLFDPAKIENEMDREINSFLKEMLNV